MSRLGLSIATLAVAALPVTGSSAAARPVSFAPTERFATDPQPTAIAAGDFDRDGNPDLAVAGSGLTLLFGDGHGGARSSTRVYVGYNVSLGGLAAADFNRDGKLDLAFVRSSPYTQPDQMPSSPQLVLLYGDGSGGFAHELDEPVDGPASFVAAVDLRRSGYAEPVFNAEPGQEATVLANDGGFMGPMFNSGGASSSSSALAVGDFNSDGYPDLALTTPEGIVVKLNDGRGSFLPDRTVGVAAGALVAADLNGDGRPDLVAVDRTAAPGWSAAIVLLGDGRGDFQPTASYTTHGFASATSQLAAADFDGDGKIDLASSGSTCDCPSEVTVLAGDGQGRFGAPRVVGQTAGEDYGVAVLDFNRDGVPDLAYPDYDTDSVSVLLDTTAAPSSPPKPAKPPARGDLIPPTISLAAPADGASYREGQAVRARYSCADEAGGSGLASCAGDVRSGRPIDTARPGIWSFTVVATDAAGNRAVETVNYDVEASAAPGEGGGQGGTEPAGGGQQGAGGSPGSSSGCQAGCEPPRPRRRHHHRRRSHRHRHHARRHGR